MWAQARKFAEATGFEVAVIGDGGVLSDAPNTPADAAPVTLADSAQPGVKRFTYIHGTGGFAAELVAKREVRDYFNNASARDLGVPPSGPPA